MFFIELRKLYTDAKQKYEINTKVVNLIICCSGRSTSIGFNKILLHVNRITCSDNKDNNILIPLALIIICGYNFVRNVHRLLKCT